MATSPTTPPQRPISGHLLALDLMLLETDAGFIALKPLVIMSVDHKGISEHVLRFPADASAVVSCSESLKVLPAFGEQIEGSVADTDAPRCNRSRPLVATREQQTYAISLVGHHPKPLSRARQLQPTLLLGGRG